MLLILADTLLQRACSPLCNGAKSVYFYTALQFAFLQNLVLSRWELCYWIVGKNGVQRLVTDDLGQANSRTPGTREDS